MVRVNFLTKVLALFLLQAFAIVLLANVTFALTAKAVLIRGLGRESVALATRARDQVDASRYEAVLAGRMDPAKARGVLTAELQEIQSRLGAHGIENLYVVAPRGDAFSVVADSSGDDLPFALEDRANLQLKREVFATGRPAYTGVPYSDAYGTWISGFVPLPGPGGKPMALLGADLPLGAFPLMDEIVRKNVLLSLAPALLFALLAGFFSARRLARPIRQLTRGLRRVQEGDFSCTIEVSSRDEVGRMASAFNAMTRDLGEKEKLRAIFDQSVSRAIAEALLGGEVRTEGEIREATVLFVDIRGFTAMSEAMPAREVIALLNGYLGALAPVVEEHGGVVDKFVGDEIFALFGVPVEIADDALAAVSCALSMRQRLGALNEARLAQQKAPIAVGIGINTGVVVAGTVGSKDRKNYTVLGNTVNVGSRLCAHAAPGQVLISQSTYLRLKGRIEARALEPLTVKGVSFPLSVFEVVGLREPEGPLASERAP